MGVCWCLIDVMLPVRLRDLKDISELGLGREHLNLLDSLGPILLHEIIFVVEVDVFLCQLF